MSAYNQNFVPPAAAPANGIQGSSLVNGLPGAVPHQQQPPQTAAAQQYLQQKPQSQLQLQQQQQQFQQPPVPYPGSSNSSQPPPLQFNSNIVNKFLPPSSTSANNGAPPPSTLPSHLRPPTANGPTTLTNGSNGANSANSSRTASPGLMSVPQQGGAPPMPQNTQYAHGAPPPAARPIQPQSVASLTSNMHQMNLNRTNGQPSANTAPTPQQLQQVPPQQQQQHQLVPPQQQQQHQQPLANPMTGPFMGNKPPNLNPRVIGSPPTAGAQPVPVPASGQRIMYGGTPASNDQQNNNLQRAAPPPGAGTAWPPSLPKAAVPGIPSPMQTQPQAQLTSFAPPQPQPQAQSAPFAPPQQYQYGQAYQQPLHQPPLPQQQQQPAPPPGMFGAQTSSTPLQYQSQPPPPSMQPQGQHPYAQPQPTSGPPQLGAPVPLNVAQQGFSRLWGQDTIDLMQNRHILSPATLPPPKVVLHNQFHESINCSPSIMRCTVTKIPETNSLLQKSRLPLGIVVHPFRDVNNLPVIQCINIVRCRLCRTYINPFVYFVDSKMWKCNLCYRVNELPEDFQFDPATKTYGDVTRRPEVRSSTIEFIAPSEYMLRPPQPAMYLFLFDVSIIAQQSGYLEAACSVLNRHLDEMPGDARTQVGFICYDSFVHFYSMAEGLNQPHEMTLLDIDEPFLPRPDSLLVNLKECKELVRDLLKLLPKRFAHTHDPGSALGSALQVAFKLMSSGGRITVFQACLPNKGPGSLEPREDPNNRSAKDVAHLNPATDFYKRFALECSGYQIACDLFLMNQQYSDMATISGISKHSGGCVHHFPLYQKTKQHMVDSFRMCFKRYLTRKIGFEAVMRIRCTRGLQVHTFHGNFFVRSTDLLSLPNVNPDAGYGMQISYEESLTDVKTICFQAALLYTNSEGERRIRVHTVCLPVTSSLPEVMHSADSEAIIGLLSKMAVDRSIASNLSDARDAFINATIDVFNAFKIAQNLPSGQSGQLIAPRSLALMPLYILGLLKHPAFRVGTSTRLDDRVYAMDCMKTLPLDQLMKFVYPELYKIDVLIYHARNSNASTTEEDDEEDPLPEVPRLQLSAEHLDSRSIFLMDCGQLIMLYVGLNVPPDVLEAVLGISSTAELGDYVYGLPHSVSAENDILQRFLLRLNYDKPYSALVQIIRDTSTAKGQFIERLTDDRSESSLSYYEFLQHIRAQVK
ncbi:protein transport protein Sec24A-like isoform X2 [Drosophila miranda]|uniref:protein transport protein Sec24A-like isoform X2 n=1 Tax=Drosophila miranda TaxID=7229 RepID=UPI0007E723A4|nr:protein transport protein Sec24A-like isoform X2 [Drosophila miranda]